MDLSHNEIGDIGGISLGQGVANNSNLSELDISWNELRVRGVIGFLNAVKVCRLIEAKITNYSGQQRTHQS